MSRSNPGKRLERSFYERETIVVAQRLLGCRLRHATGLGATSGVIVETEAYLGPGDGASHARGGPTKRSLIMFGRPGIAYVYFVYGMHFMFNVVTEPEGMAGAVLIRAVEPSEGSDLMALRRGRGDHCDLANGPARLTQAFDITLDKNGSDLTTGRLGIFSAGQQRRFKIVATPRIGVVGSREKPWRFLIKDNPNVSRL